METKEQIELRVKKQVEKIMLVLAGIFFVWCMIQVFKKDKSDINPCDCADLSSKAKLVGEWHLSETQRKKLIDCESVYTYVEEAYNDCVNNSIKEIH